MKLIMTMTVRDEVDILEANLLYHLERGVDAFVIVDDHSEDGTSEILEKYRRQGEVHIFPRPDRPVLQGELATVMARFAATHLRADWVIGNDADEFWWPDLGSLSDVLNEIPKQYGAIAAPRTEFIPRPQADGFFADRMIVREAFPARDLSKEVRDSGKRALRDDREVLSGAPAPSTRTFEAPKWAHRAHHRVVVNTGNHGVTVPGLRKLRGWFPINVMHFPIRSYAQWERKLHHAMRAEASGYYWEGIGPREQDLVGERLQGLYRHLALDDDKVKAGKNDGSLVIDRRLQVFFARSGWPLGVHGTSQAPSASRELAVEPGAHHDEALQDSCASSERQARLVGSIVEYERLTDWQKEKESRRGKRAARGEKNATRELRAAERHMRKPEVAVLMRLRRLEVGRKTLLGGGALAGLALAGLALVWIGPTRSRASCSPPC